VFSLRREFVQTVEIQTIKETIISDVHVWIYCFWIGLWAVKYFGAKEI